MVRILPISKMRILEELFTNFIEGKGGTEPSDVWFAISGNFSIPVVGPRRYTIKLILAATGIEKN